MSKFVIAPCVLILRAEGAVWAHTSETLCNLIPHATLATFVGELQLCLQREQDAPKAAIELQGNYNDSGQGGHQWLARARRESLWRRSRARIFVHVAFVFERGAIPPRCVRTRTEGVKQLTSS